MNENAVEIDFATKEEIELIELLTDAVKRYLGLPNSAGDKSEFIMAIKAAQRIVMIRPIVRMTEDDEEE